MNNLRELPIFSMLIRSRDWHPQTHCSFAVNNPGAKLFETIVLSDTKTEQTMWPVHCVQDTFGAEYHSEIVTKPTDYVVSKG